jgi:hypothetical protein
MWDDDHSSNFDGLAGPNPVVGAIEAIAAHPTEISARFGTLTVNTVSSGQQLKPVVARDAAGDFVVAWEDDQDENGFFEILARGFNSDGTQRFATQMINTVSSGQQLKPAVAMDDAGNFVVAWEDDQDQNGFFEILARGFNSDGTQHFNAQTINTVSSGQQLKPAVAMDAAGSFVVAWEDDQDQNGFFEILARGFNLDGTQHFATQTINTVSSGQQLKPAVAMDAAGNFVVAWEDDQDENGFFEVLAQGEPAGLLRRNVDGVLPNAVSTSDLLGDLGVGRIGAEVVELFSEHLGWQWIDRHNPYRSVTGVVEESRVTHEDFPTSHLSHDQNFHVLVDEGQEGLVSVANSGPLDFIDSNGQRRDIEVEWETGIRPSETTGDGTAGLNGQAIFPKWVWPSAGDRVWVNGNWIYDIGHQEDGRFRSEIHPPRAIAVMRNQIVPLEASGGVPIEVTATDLYIHGDSGLAKPVIELIDRRVGVPLRPQSGLDPIDENFEFDIPLPPRPGTAPSAEPVVEIEPGPGNTVDIPLGVELDESGRNLHVTVPLAGSGVTPLDVYARRIWVGWQTPVEDLRHVRLTLDSMRVNDDMDPFGDGELSFFWLNVGTVPGREWIRLSDHTTQNMNDLGSGSTVNFTGTTFDYYTDSSSSNIVIPIFADGYDQDGVDDFFGSSSLGPGALDNNDPYGPFPAGPRIPVPISTQPATFTLQNSGDQYRLTFRVQEIS